MILADIQMNFIKIKEKDYMGILNTIIEEKKNNLKKLIEKYGINDPKVIKESQLLDIYLVWVQTYNNKILD